MSKVTFTGNLEDFQSDLWRGHIPVPEGIARQFIEGDNRRVICTLNGEVSFHCALMSSKEYWFVLVNMELRKKLLLDIGDKVEVALEKDHSEYGMPVPESFQVLLDQDEEGAAHFHALTMGKRRSLIYMVGKVKNVDSQINKGMAVLDHLKQNKGKLNFRELNALIKIYNKRHRL